MCVNAQMTAVRRSQQAGTQVGKAAMQARQLAASHPDNPRGSPTPYTATRAPPADIINSLIAC